MDAFESTKLLGEYQKAVKGRKPNVIQPWHVIAQFLELYFHSKRKSRGKILLKKWGQ